jgi:hypothetical protein
MVIMIMAVNPPESFPTSGLDSATSQHLQRLVLLNNESRDAYQVAANLATDRRLVDLSQQTALERQGQAATLQNILWCNGTPSKTEPRGETESDRRIYKVLNESPQQLHATLIDELLKIDEQLCECYENVRNSIPGRGIRQLLTEQAMGIQRRRKSVLDLRLQIANPNSSQTSETVDQRSD